MTSKLSVSEVHGKLTTFNFSNVAKPGRNKGERGQLIEVALGIPNTSNLTDLVDGELKTFTQGESIAVTQLKHCLSEIIEDGVSFADSKVGEKLNQTIYVGFTRSNDYLGSVVLNAEIDSAHYQQLEEDYNFICDQIRIAFERGVELDQLGFFSKGKPSHTITGPNKLLQIRTKGSKTTKGDYVPLTFAGCTFNNKGMAFYLCGKFGKEVL